MFSLPGFESEAIEEQLARVVLTMAEIHGDGYNPNISDIKNEQPTQIHHAIAYGSDAVRSSVCAIPTGRSTTVT